ncbi:MAG: F0F1 ATP synthase subunit alpha [Lachnospiraceae bacterium]|nr:F0F1 ATP synthase subunit alpha [Lachnospiraceae bacterium]
MANGWPEGKVSKKKKTLAATLLYVTPPTEEQLQGIREFVYEKYVDEDYRREDILFTSEQDTSLGGGFILQVGNEVYNWSTEGRISALRRKLDKIRDSVTEDQDVVSIIHTTIREFELTAKQRSIGHVTYVGDGIAHIQGLSHAQYGEIILFECGIKGMVQNIEEDSIGVILFGSDREVRVGSRATRMKMRAGVPVGDDFLGRVINALGEPIDGRGKIESDDYYPVERPAPTIVERQPVSVPMETGILAIDSMFPIGRGQRELIIGDRQTGKTSIALDTILNQKDKGVICIYVAIGQKNSTVAKIVNTLQNADAMDYSIVLSATAADPAPLQYIAPYAGTALAEYFMSRGRDVLIIYDDLSKHAVAYRALSLLLERSPGREAYPGDVFYLHSRLLERSARLSEAFGDGSITALPIIETQAGDVSAYIPTNVISITDGQIYLESELFNLGTRPAVNVGLSVSRVGGAAQTKAMKKAAGSIRIDLAQFREMEVFTQFSSDLDEATKSLLHHGRVLMELLKQPLGRPLSMAEQVVTLVAANHHVMEQIGPEQVKDFQMRMLDDFAQNDPAILSDIAISKTLGEEMTDRIVTHASKFAESYLAESKAEETDEEAEG